MEALVAMEQELSAAKMEQAQSVSQLAVVTKSFAALEDKYADVSSKHETLNQKIKVRQ